MQEQDPLSMGSLRGLELGSPGPTPAPPETWCPYLWSGHRGDTMKGVWHPAVIRVWSPRPCLASPGN